jgi:hypothetical protein
MRGRDALLEAIFALSPVEQRLDYFSRKRPGGILHRFFGQHAYFNQSPTQPLSVLTALLARFYEAPGGQAVPRQPVLKLLVRQAANGECGSAVLDEDRLNGWTVGKTQQAA